MRVLLDTVTFIWSIHSPELISKKAKAAMEAEGAIRELSTLSLSEIAVKQAKGKLRLGRTEVWTGISDLRLGVLAYGASHAYQLFDLPWHHNDPFDRMIIAQALAEKIPVVTSDSKFRLYQGLQVIW